jgi:hypothetical protein
MLSRLRYTLRKLLQVVRGRPSEQREALGDTLPAHALIVFLVLVFAVMLLVHFLQPTD